jgi:repressor LexA
MENVISLTQNEKNVLEYIETFMSESGIAPTFQEIKDNFGFVSYNSVQRYLKQLQAKGYISVPGGNQKRAIQLLQPASALKKSLALVLEQKQQTFAVSTPTRVPAVDGPQRELLSLPLLGKVAAGRPLEAVLHEEFTEVPPSLVRNPNSSYTLEVSGNSMIEDGIFDGDVLIVQEQKAARNGEISVCVVDNEATVKRFYLHQGSGLARPQVELRPANADMDSMWYSPDQVEIRGIVIGLLRKF